jgi:hypothetical protein
MNMLVLMLRLGDTFQYTFNLQTLILILFAYVHEQTKSSCVIAMSSQHMYRAYINWMCVIENYRHIHIKQPHRMETYYSFAITVAYKHQESSSSPSQQLLSKFCYGAYVPNVPHPDTGGHAGVRRRANSQPLRDMLGDYHRSLGAAAMRPPDVWGVRGCSSGAANAASRAVAQTDPCAGAGAGAPQALGRHHRQRV